MQERMFYKILKNNKGSRATRNLVLGTKCVIIK